MNNSSSTIRWLQLAREGDSEAQRELWDRFFPELVQLARKRMVGVRRTASDEEDVALSVLQSFFSGAAENRFPDLRGSDSLWRLLCWMTHRKAIDWLRHQSRQKRSTLGESALDVPGRPELRGMDQVVDPLPTPELDLLLIEEARRLMNALPPPMQRIATLKLDGYSNQEIAEAVDCSLATVERRLKMIREIWRQSGDEPQSIRSSTQRSAEDASGSRDVAD